MDRAELLRRFEQWLDSALADEEPPAGIPPELLGADAPGDAPPTDRHALWAALTALTTEIKLQGRAFKQLSENLAADAEQRGRRQSFDALLEMRERLSRGLESVPARQELIPSFWDRVFAARWRQLEHAHAVSRALEEGYRMSLEHLNDLLSQFNLRPIECLGRPFDPRRMSAVDVEETAAAAEGTVVFVYRAGYELNGELFRPAQVRVARQPGHGDIQ